MLGIIALIITLTQETLAAGTPRRTILACLILSCTVLPCVGPTLGTPPLKRVHGQSSTFPTMAMAGSMSSGTM